MITRSILSDIRRDLDAAIAAVGKKHGYSIKTGACTYSDAAATFKVEVATIAEGGRAMTKEAACYKSLAEAIGLVPLFSTVFIGGESHTVVGYNARSRTKPVIVERQRDGAMFKCAERVARRVSGLSGIGNE